MNETITSDERAQIAQLHAQAQQAEIVRLRYENAQLSLRLKYALADGDAVDLATGVITRAPKPEFIREHVEANGVALAEPS